MSIRSLANRAADRDTGYDIKTRRRQLGEGEPAAGPKSDLSSATAALVDAIPGEVLAPYTALVGVIVSTASATNRYEALRWSLFGAGIALVAVSLLVAFLRNRPAAGRKFPVLEAFAAMLAFAAWGLVMPGSPLALRVAGDNLTVTTAVIAIGGAFFVTLLAPALTKDSSKAPK